jgi:hypothetical protein
VQFQSSVFQCSLTKPSLPSSVKIGLQIRSEVTTTGTSIGGFCAGGADGSVPLLREHCEVATSCSLSIQEAAYAKNQTTNTHKASQRAVTAPVEGPCALQPYLHTERIARIGGNLKAGLAIVNIMRVT